MPNRPDIALITGHNTDTPHPPAFLGRAATQAVRRLHASVPGYEPTPLLPLKSLAQRLGVRAVYLKDESRRFGLNAFKGLGAVYAVTRVVCEKIGIDAETVTFEALREPAIRAKIADMVFVTATDGNHGKGVAWAAGLLGCAAHVYMPRGSSEMRAQAIRDAGRAQVTITDLSYDDTVRHALAMSQQKGWTLVQDTSWEGYEQIPAWIMQGYTTMVYEAAEQLRAHGAATPTHLLLQAGVGAMAGAVIGAAADCYPGQMPVIAVIEPDQAACLFESARRGDGEPHPATGSGNTIMAGLNCGEPCTIAWPILRDYTAFFAACADGVAEYGMRLLAHPEGGDPSIISGESGAATLGALALIAERPELSAWRRAMGFDEEAVILLFNTEGDTDPEAYRAIVQAE